MLPWRLRPAFEQSVFELQWSLDRRQSLVDPRDVTDVACTVLTDSDRHTGATYELASQGRYTAHDLGDIISRVLNRPIEVRQTDPDTHLKAWLADPEQFDHQIHVVRGIMSRYSSHDFVGNPNVLTWLLQRPPTTFEQFVRQQYDTFAAVAHSQP